MVADSKVINTKLEKNLLFRYEQIKERLGIQNDAEVVRFLVAHYYNNSFKDVGENAQTDYEKALPYINKFMNRYEKEWKNLGE
jgi:hypothetical protein